MNKNQDEQKKIWECKMSNLKPGTNGISLTGNPRVVKSPFGDAIWFDGEKDGIFLESNPIKGLDSFTIEVLFCPDMNGPEEQRFLHIGEIDGDRLLIETRSTKEAKWYLDTFILSGESKKALIDPKLVHPIGPWYHVALTLDSKGKMTNYVNGIYEMEGFTEYSPINSGEMSTGVRRNKVSWYKGAIYKIRISPKVLDPGAFMDFYR